MPSQWCILYQDESWDAYQWTQKTKILRKNQLQLPSKKNNTHTKNGNCQILKNKSWIIMYRQEDGGIIKHIKRKMNATLRNHFKTFLHDCTLQLTMACCRRDWKKTSAESYFMPPPPTSPHLPPQWPDQSKDWLDLTRHCSFREVSERLVVMHFSITEERKKKTSTTKTVTTQERCPHPHRDPKSRHSADGKGAVGSLIYKAIWTEQFTALQSEKRGHLGWWWRDCSAICTECEQLFFLNLRSFKSWVVNICSVWLFPHVWGLWEKVSQIISHLCVCVCVCGVYFF